MVSIDIDPVALGLQILNFLVLLAALNYLLYRPIRGIIRQRAEKKAQLSNDIETNQELIEAHREEMEARLAKARLEGLEVKEKLQQEARLREREILEEAAIEMERALTAVREQVTKDLGQARQELSDQIHLFGRELAQKILGRSIQ